MYVGLEGEPPNHPALEYFDEASGRIGTLRRLQGDHYRSEEAPYLRVELRQPESLGDRRSSSCERWPGELRVFGVVPALIESWREGGRLTGRPGPGSTILT